MPRLLTYNVHRCVGVDRRLDIDRIVGVIAEHDPDIVCLQELDVGRARTGFIDQACAIAEGLSMSFHFHPAMQVEAELYGGALWSVSDIDGVQVNVLNTHLGLVPREQRLQAQALAGPDWLGHPDCAGPTILTGDFNATSMTRPYQLLANCLPDAQRTLGLKPSIKTFPSSFPAIRIDHCFVSSDIIVRSMFAPFSPLARMASDHLPLIMDFDVNPEATRRLVA